MFIYEEAGKKALQGTVLTGKDLIDVVSFPQGPLIGKVLRAITQAHLSGVIKNKDEALKMARSFLHAK